MRYLLSSPYVLTILPHAWVSCGCGHTSTIHTPTPPPSDGVEWKRLRSALGRPVAPRRLLDYVARLEQTAEVFLQVARESASADKEGFTEDALQLLQRWAMEGEPSTRTHSHTHTHTHTFLYVCACEIVGGGRVLFKTLCAVHLPTMARESHVNGIVLSDPQ